MFDKVLNSPLFPMKKNITIRTYKTKNRIDDWLELNLQKKDEKYRKNESIQCEQLIHAKPFLSITFTNNLSRVYLNLSKRFSCLRMVLKTNLT